MKLVGSLQVAWSGMDEWQRIRQLPQVIKQVVFREEASALEIELDLEGIERLAGLPEA